MRSSKLAYVAATCLTLASAAWCLSAGARIGVTFDEPVYVAAGLDRWRTGEVGGLMRLGTMPLPVDVVTLPVYVWERWRGQPFAIATDGRGRVTRLDDLHVVLPVARAATLVFWGVLLLYGALIARSLAGPWAGTLAVAMLATEPSFLAHASLATTDVALAACILALGYHTHAGRSRGWTFRVGLPAVWFGLAVLSKASALYFGPLCLAGIAWGWGAWRPCAAGAPARLARRVFAWWHDTRCARCDAMQIVFLGLVLAVVYCGSDWQREESFVDWARALPDGWVSGWMVPIAERLRVFSNAGEGLVQQLKHNIRGHESYLLGRSIERAVWYYYPVLLTIKLSLPLLVVVVLVTAAQRAKVLNWAVRAALLPLLLSPLLRIQLGVRLVLPALALLIVGVAAGAATWIRQRRAGRDRGLACALVTLWLGSSLAVAASVWPDGIRFVNRAWGGTGGGYRLVSDSNYDWGQGLPELDTWHASAGRPALAVWYWGADPALLHGPWLPVALHEAPWRPAGSLHAFLRGRYLAVSTTLLFGGVLTGNRPVAPAVESARRQAAAVRAWLAAQPVAARTSTFLIYDFTVR